MALKRRDREEIKLEDMVHWQIEIIPLESLCHVQ
jgi:hypothetical protein